jgi:copper homeostasis protein (lipoprotein)
MRASLLVALLPLSLLAACHRTEDTASVAPAATVAAPATVEAAPAATVAAPVGISESAAPGEHTMFDAKAFAGDFADAGTQVNFTADGTYTMTAHAESAKADLATDGTWTLEPDHHHVRLDPNSKAEQDRVYEIVSMDELHADNGQVLRRSGTSAQH